MSKPLYDDHGVSKWIGIPSLFFGVFVIWIAISTFCQYYLDLEFRFQIRGDAPNPFLAIIVCLALGCFMSNVYFLRNRCYFDPKSRDLVMRHNCIFGKFDKIVSMRNAESLYIQRGKTIRGGRVYFDFCIRFRQGGSYCITRVNDSWDLPISQFSAATGLSVEGWSLVHDDGKSKANTNEEAEQTMDVNRP